LGGSGRPNAPAGISILFRLDIADDISLSTAPSQKSCWPQAVFPIYPAIEVEENSSLLVDITVKNERLFVRPLNLDAKRECIRMREPTNFFAMNQTLIKRYFHDSIRHLKLDEAVDLTSLLLDDLDGCEFLYNSEDKEYVRFLKWDRLRNLDNVSCEF
jgi:hypothetical protein